MNIDQAVLAALFLDARTHNGWQPRPVEDELIRKLYDVCRMGPTSANCSPGRFVFVRTPEAKARIEPALSSGNRVKTMTAPVTVIAAYDSEFYEKLPHLFPHGDARSWFTSSPGLSEETAFRNGTLQAGYLILAARALGLDAGPLSGFDNAKIDAEFLDSTKWKSNFLINLGYGDAGKRFRAADWETSGTGCPRLNDALVSFDCEVKSVANGETHDVLFCEVVSSQATAEGGALMYFDRDYHAIGARGSR